MSDALALPSLAASTLSQVLDFLLRRAEVMLDRRAAGGDGGDAVRAAATPAVVVQAPGAGDFDPSALTQQLEDRIVSLVELLGVYAEHPELVSGGDERLMRNLAALRSALENAYGQPITLQGEDRRGGMRIRQDEQEIHGRVRGVKARRVGVEGRVDVVQTSKTVHPGAEVIGAEIDELD